MKKRRNRAPILFTTNSSNGTEGEERASVSSLQLDPAVGAVQMMSVVALLRNDRKVSCDRIDLRRYKESPNINLGL